MYTRCPHCATVFRVTPQQLQASSGQVKCGRCQAQFDAFASLAASLPGGHDARPGDAARMPAANPADRPIGTSEQAISFAPSTSPAPASAHTYTPAPASPTVSEVHAPAEDQVAAYVHRYGARVQQDTDAPPATDAHGETSHAEDDEAGAGEAAPSSIDQFADSLRVLQAVAQLSLDVDDARPRPHADQPWVEAVTDEAADAHVSQPDPATLSSSYEAAWAVHAETREAGTRDDGYISEAHADESEVIDLAAPPVPAPELPPPALTVPDALLEGGAVPLRQRGRWLAAVAGLALALAVQALWWFASPVANALPGTRAPLELACGVIGCEVALPQRPEQLSIEGSDLQLLDVARPQEVLLTAQIRNRAEVAQQLPAIELTLIDTANRVVGRRVLRPADYVEAGRRVQDGIAGNEEVSVRLYLNTGGLRAAGYRLYLFFG